VVQTSLPASRETTMLVPEKEEEKQPQIYQNKERAQRNTKTCIILYYIVRLLSNVFDLPPDIDLITPATKASS
jgi:hypothetical protein